MCNLQADLGETQETSKFGGGRNRSVSRGLRMSLEL